MIYEIDPLFRLVQFNVLSTNIGSVDELATLNKRFRFRAKIVVGLLWLRPHLPSPSPASSVGRA
jgi:hypothetical protein